MFTSGTTTGTPKQVVAPHKSLAHFLDWQRGEFGLAAGDRCAQLTGLSFDVLFRDVFVALVSGATLVVPEEGERLVPRALLEWLGRERITVVHTVPSVARTWIAEAESHGVSQPLALRWLFSAGEPLDDRTVRRWRAVFPGRVVNVYGPSETVLAKFRYWVPDPPRPGVQPLGQPLPYTQAFVVGIGDDAARVRLCGIGEAGELAIRTPFRSIVRPGEPGADQFVPNRWTERPAPDDLVYLTGDRARWTPDGLIEYLGRLDDQVKIRGVRVSPEEVARAVRGLPGVRDAAVLAVRDGGDTALAAFVVTAPGAGAAGLSALEVRGALRAVLPTAMLPGTVTFLDALPVTRNGKVDRARLRELPRQEAEIAAADQPVNDVQRQLAVIWRQVLGTDTVGVFDNFFDLGGHSLLLIEVHRRIRETFGRDIPIVDLFRNPTIATLADGIENPADEAGEQRLDAARARGARRRHRHIRPKAEEGQTR
jgi:acyl-coenzyme A synthetase/AMP-(fatty) acid ligase/acyl carrier protein